MSDVDLFRKNPVRLDQFFELGTIGAGIVGGRPVPGEQRRRHHVDPGVGGLRRQDGGHRQLQRGGEVQLAVGVGELHRQLRRRAGAPAGYGPAASPGGVTRVRLPLPCTTPPSGARSASGTLDTSPESPQLPDETRVRARADSADTGHRPADPAGPRSWWNNEPIMTVFLVLFFPLLLMVFALLDGPRRGPAADRRP